MSKRKLPESEKKKRKAARSKIYGATRINIGDQMNRWDLLKTELNILNNAEMAELLLDSWSVKNLQPKKNSNLALVDFKSIRGLPVNKPFRIKYSSGGVESKVYIIVEHFEVGVTPSMIDGMGDQEVSSETFSSKVAHNITKKRCVDRLNKDEFNQSFPVDGFDRQTETRESDTDSVGLKEVDGKINMASEILNEIIDGVVNQYNIHLHYACVQTTEGDEGGFSKKQKGSRDLNTFKKKQNVIKLDNSTDNVPRSSRIRSKGYRINYADLNELNSESDNNDLGVLSDNSGVNDTLEMIENKPCTTKLLGKKNKDPDFIPVSYKAIEYDVLGSSSSEDVDDFMIEDPKEGTKKEEQSKSFQQKERSNKEDERVFKRFARKRERQTVNLSEHPEKYYIVEQVSVQMKDRGKSDSEKTSKLMVCAECHKFRTKDRSLMETHLEHHLNGDFSCTTCEFLASGIKEMYRHTNEHHSSVKKKKIFCLLCEERFTGKQFYQNHLKTVHNLLPYLCSICSTKDSPVTFKNIQIYKEHYIEKHKERMYQCSYCGLYQFNRQSLGRHACAGRSDLDTAVPCDICGKEMRHDSLLFHKRRVHFNVRPFPCPECKYAASQAHRLQQHIQAKHGGTHNFKCDECDFTCVRPSQLASHQRTHTGYKPYKCDQCPYAAAWNVQLKDHKKLHGNALGKECKRCGILIRAGAPYTKHMRKEHNDDGT